MICHLQMTALELREAKRPKRAVRDSTSLSLTPKLRHALSISAHAIYQNQFLNYCVELNSFSQVDHGVDQASF